ncbi:MAG: hypothetical protein IMZ57_04865 [Acidobacteria bacterium]|nr:hypothetical protein [Acidobacteriota bacterium]
MMGKKEKRIIGLVVGLVILASAIGVPAVKAAESPIPYTYLPSLVPILAANMLALQQGGGSDAEKLIRIASEITILRTSSRD